MKRVAQFYKVSSTEFLKEVDDISCYNDIVLPKRATKYSAGYDFFAPYDFTLNPGEIVKIPTGIRCKMNEDYVLMIYPRSSLGFKYRLQLNNTVGVIDADYYNAKNEGHIFIKMTNCGDKVLEVKKGEAFAQGIFMEYAITFDDEVDSLRTGGIGSTTNK